MGMFGAATSRVNVEAIAERLRPAVQAWYNGRIQVIRPADASLLHWDPATDERTAPPGTVFDGTVLYDSGERGALVQPIRSAAPITVTTQATNIYSVRFQAVRPADGVDLHAGLLLKVVDGGEDPSLESFVYSLKGQPGTSLQWGLILEATVVTSSRWG